MVWKCPQNKLAVRAAVTENESTPSDLSESRFQLHCGRKAHNKLTQYTTLMFRSINPSPALNMAFL